MIEEKQAKSAVFPFINIRTDSTRFLPSVLSIDFIVFLPATKPAKADFAQYLSQTLSAANRNTTDFVGRIDKLMTEIKQDLLFPYI